MKQSNAHNGATTEAAVNDDEVSLPRIGGRECVPVRLLPIVTSWQPLSPDKIAELLGAGEKVGGRQWPISARAFRSDGHHIAVRRGRWADIGASLEELRGTLLKYGASSDEWEARSLEKLPAGVFVWRDELEAQYERTYGRREFLRSRPNARLLSEKHKAAQLRELLGAEDEASLVRLDRRVKAAVVELDGDGQLNFRVVLTKAEDDVVFEGFEPLTNRGVAAAVTSVATVTADPGEGQASMHGDSSAQEADRGAAPTPAPRKVKFGRPRQWHILTPLIDEAIRGCGGSTDINRVWPELCAMAERKPPPTPMIGRTSDGLVQYRKSASSEEPGEFTRENLRRYLNRRMGLE